MKRTHIHRMVTVALGLMVVALLVLGPRGEALGQLSKEGPGTAIQSAPGLVTPTVTSQDDKEQLRQAILTATTTLTGDGTYYLSIDKLIVDSNWALAVLAPKQGLCSLFMAESKLSTIFRSTISVNHNILCSDGQNGL